MTITMQSPEYIFPTKILISEDSSFDEYKYDMVRWMNDYSFKHDSFNRSNFGGYQSPDDFYLEESFSPYLNRLTEWITSTYKEYTRGSKLEDAKLRLCNMWFNFNHQYCYNVEHTHPGSLLAGVIWIRIPEDSPPIAFADPLSFASSEISDDAHREFDPIDGQMAMFPAHIPHRVDINESEQTRVSMSFNLVNY
tara:strand:- start:558 stop:1139 length:582 start_codon:yes stop_codon:yes gene_type:complete